MDNLRTSFSQVGETDIEQLSEKSMDQIDKVKSEKKSPKTSDIKPGIIVFMF
jgi:hypothetical protein